MAEKNRTTGPRSGLPPPDAAGLWGPLSGLRREMDRLFDDFGTSRWPVSGAIRLIADMPPMPAMDLVESDGSYEITLELPGIDEKDVELKVGDDMLTLRSEKREESERMDKDCHASERRYGSFQRSLRLPPDADAGKIDATCANGVLCIIIPKSEQARAQEQKIEIRRGGFVRGRPRPAHRFGHLLDLPNNHCVKPTFHREVSRYSYRHAASRGGSGGSRAATTSTADKCLSLVR